MKEFLSSGYDYMINVTIKQGRLLSPDELWGDGSVYGHNRAVFNQLYSALKQLIEENNLFP